MTARDASGNQISLLNVDPVPQTKHRPTFWETIYTSTASYHLESTIPASHLSLLLRNSSSAPETPGLLRSDSYDLQDTTEPGLILSCIRERRYSAYSNGHKEDSYASRPVLEKGPKRYPCQATHGCHKTFTTSGHASRHRKVHTTEKAVACTHPGCQAMFSRLDNMKQHLEKHCEGKSRDWHKTSGAQCRAAKKRAQSLIPVHEWKAFNGPII
jgi:hypothetical protein